MAKHHIDEVSFKIISDEEYKCHCKWGYVGKRCEVASACLRNVCRGRGECIIKQDGSSECICLRGYYGPTCEYEEDRSFLSIVQFILFRGSLIFSDLMFQVVVVT